MSRVKDFFIPHAGNNYRPHSLQRVAAFVMTLMMLMTFTLATLMSSWWLESDWMVGAVLPALVVEETNKERQANAMLPVTRSEVLDRAATLKAEHMASNSYFSHYSPDGISPWFWFDRVSYNYVHAGENLAVHFNDSSHVVEAWMQSPTHRANILNQQYDEIGIGIARGTYEGFETVFVVQLFGTPVRAEAAPLAAVTAVERLAPLEPFVAIPAPSTTTSTPASAVSGTEVEMVVTETLAVSSAQRELAQVSTTTVGTSSLDVADVYTLVGSEDTWFMADSFMATSSSTTAPASVSFMAPEPPVGPPAWAVAITQPGTLLQYAYGAMAALVVTLLLLAVAIEVRRQDPVQIIYALTLLWLLGGLWWLHTSHVGTIIVT